MFNITLHHSNSMRLIDIQKMTFRSLNQAVKQNSKYCVNVWTVAELTVDFQESIKNHSQIQCEHSEGK